MKPPAGVTTVRPTMKLGADLSREEVEAFNAFCHQEGYLKGRAAEASLRLFRWLPAELRSLLMRGDKAAVRKYFALIDELPDILSRATDRG